MDEHTSYRYLRCLLSVFLFMLELEHIRFPFRAFIFVYTKPIANLYYIAITYRITFLRIISPIIKNMYFLSLT